MREMLFENLTITDCLIFHSQSYLLNIRTGMQSYDILTITLVFRMSHANVTITVRLYLPLFIVMYSQHFYFMDKVSFLSE